MPDKWIVSDPKVMMGKPVVAGTRITVELILEKLAAGESVEQVLARHPQLDRAAIQAALAFAAQALRADVVYPLAEAGMADYLANLEDYEDRLARGEIAS